MATQISDSKVLNCSTCTLDVKEVVQLLNGPENNCLSFDLTAVRDSGPVITISCMIDQSLMIIEMLNP